MRTYSIALTKDFSWDFEKFPHAIISGSTGTGKTYLLAYLMYHFVKTYHAEVYIIDPKLSDMFSIGKRISNNNVASTSEEVIAMLEAITKQMDERYLELNSFNKFGLTSYKINKYPIVLIIDEAAALLSIMNKKDKETYSSLIKNLILKSRASGIQIIFSLQQANAQNIPTEIRENTSFKVLLGHANSINKQMLFGLQNKDTPIFSIADNDIVPNEWSGKQKSFSSLRTGLYMTSGMTEPKIFQPPDLSDFSIELDLLPLF